jgi:hypothetical protein
MSRRLILFSLLVLTLSACSPVQFTTLTPSSIPTTTTPSSTPFTPVVTASLPSVVLVPALTPTAKPLVPDFAHIVMIVFENKEFGTVIGNPKMPVFNHLAQEYTLLTQHYAVTHPSLPNYLAMVGGDTFGIRSDCEDCFVNAKSLPDLIEASGRTWKAYQEDMPSPCFVGSRLRYAQKHNPFIYFDPIRKDAARCQRILPLTVLDEDLAAGTLPNFTFITPNLCNDAHDCQLGVADEWLGKMMNRLLPALEASKQTYLIVLTWDEGQGDHSCCGLPEKAGGRVATVLVSPQAKSGFQDDTPYTHYSLLKTIESAWGVPYLGHSADAENALIVAPWN